MKFCRTSSLLLGFVLSALAGFSQTFSAAPNAPILDVTTNNYSQLVTGLSPSTLDTTNFGLEQVCINLTHTWDQDLLIQIIAPDGTTATLSSGHGGSDDNYTNTCFRQDATVAIGLGTAPFTGTFIPDGQMGLINNGQNGNGTWTLRIVDQAGGDTGVLLSWSITFGNQPASYFSFRDSNLPIVIIETNGQAIQDDPKIMADFGIIWNGLGNRNAVTDPHNDYDGKVGIEYRGSSSQSFAKKPYSLELWDVNGNAINAPILGMPSESDWALIAAFSDKTMLRNALTYRLGERIGHYAPRGQLAEVMLNGEYVGVYYLCERIKRDSNRVNISKLRVQDISGDQLSGGYIIKVDKGTGNSNNYWNSLYPPANNPSGNPVEIYVHYPKDGDLMPQQLTYIHSFSDSFELALHGPNFMDSLVGYRRYIDVPSFVDYFLMQEFVKNLDAYRSSCYMYKDRDSKGGKLKMGPLWDFDLSMGNGDFCNFWLTNGWAHEFNNVCPGDGWEVPFWWARLLQDPSFAQAVRCRWEELKLTEFDLNNVFAWLDSSATYINEGQQRNFKAWPILGTYVWPNYYIAADYQGEVDTLKWYLRQRVAWLDANLPGVPGNCNLVGLATEMPSDLDMLYPNPSAGLLKVKAGFGQIDGLVLQVFDMQGRLLYSKSVQNEENVDLTGFAAGVYAYRIDRGLQVGKTRRLVLQ